MPPLHVGCQEPPGRLQQTPAPGLCPPPPFAGAEVRVSQGQRSPQEGPLRFTGGGSGGLPGGVSSPPSPPIPGTQGWRLNRPAVQTPRSWGAVTRETEAGPEGGPRRLWRTPSLHPVSGSLGEPARDPAPAYRTVAATARASPARPSLLRPRRRRADFARLGAPDPGAVVGYTFTCGPARALPAASPPAGMQEGPPWSQPPAGPGRLTPARPDLP